jgi:hypothetical protein
MAVRRERPRIEKFKKGHSMTATAKKTKRQAPTRKVLRADQMVKVHQPEQEQPKDRGEKPRVVGMRDVPIGIEFRRSGEDVRRWISPEKIGLTMLFIKEFANAENAKTALAEVAKMMAS